MQKKTKGILIFLFLVVLLLVMLMSIWQQFGIEKQSDVQEVSVELTWPPAVIDAPNKSRQQTELGYRTTTVRITQETTSYVAQAIKSPPYTDVEKQQLADWKLDMLQKIAQYETNKETAVDPHYASYAQSQINFYTLLLKQFDKDFPKLETSTPTNSELWKKINDKKIVSELKKNSKKGVYDRQYDYFATNANQKVKISLSFVDGEMIELTFPETDLYVGQYADKDSTFSESVKEYLTPIKQVASSAWEWAGLLTQERQKKYTD